MLSWQQTEFILKGVFLGLLLMVALREPAWVDLGYIGLYTVGVFALCLAVAAYHKLREGYKVGGRWAGFLLFLLLENPVHVYLGVLVGFLFGAYTVLFAGYEEPTYFVAPVLGGAVLGYGFWLLRHVRVRRIRYWISAALAAGLVGGAIALIHLQPFTGGFVLTENRQLMIGVLLLTGLPLFYLLTFAGLVEESEIEIGAMCAALGIGLYILASRISDSPYTPGISLLVPIALYVVYTRRILPHLRVFKHVLRGITYGKVGQLRPALVSFNRALQLDPTNNLAQEQLWTLHREMDLDKLKAEPETLDLVNYELCMERVAWLLLQTPPRSDQLQEAERLLGLVQEQRPVLEPRCAYWRAVAFLHQKNHERAAINLHEVLTSADSDNPHRRYVLLQAWHLALFLHPEMKKRVGEPLLQEPGRRMEAIAAAERQLNLKPQDPAAWDIKRLLYADLTEAEYDAAAGPEAAARDFDHAYALQLGQALAEDASRWQRGCEFLRIAARGLPAQAPAIFLHIGKIHEKAGDNKGLWTNIDRARRIGKKVGPENLSAEDRESLFNAVKQLGEHAMNAGDIQTALDAFQFYTLNPRVGQETYSTLAELYERKAKQNPDAQGKPAEHEIWIALHCTEHALTYDPKNKDLLERKDRYYYSVTPEELKKRLDNVYKWFDVDYCKTKARQVIEKHASDLDLLDWGNHLIELAQVAQPQSFAVKVLRARILRVRGEIDQAVALLEEVRQNKPEKWPSAEEEEAWFFACRILGEMYIDERPDQAVLCLQEYRKSPKSGANTMYSLGRAYENLGDPARATRCYEQVLAFEGNPLTYEAREALDRLRMSGAS